MPTRVPDISKLPTRSGSLRQLMQAQVRLQGAGPGAHTNPPRPSNGEVISMPTLALLKMLRQGWTKHLSTIPWSQIWPNTDHYLNLGSHPSTIRCPRSTTHRGIMRIGPTTTKSLVWVVRSADSAKSPLASILTSMLLKGKQRSRRDRSQNHQLTRPPVS